MDSLTHTVLGACLGEVIAGKKAGKKAMLLGAIANNFPDIDIVSSLWLNPQDAVLAHRGFTHSILFALIATPLLSLTAKMCMRKTDLPFRTWIFLTGSGFIVHIFMDACTAYGTGWFEPFSHVRVSFNSLFILDPFILLVCLATTLALILVKSSHHKRNYYTHIAISTCCLYLVTAFAIRFMVNKKVGENFSYTHMKVQQYMVTPAPLSIFLWYIVAKTDTGYYTGYYSVFDKTDAINFVFTPINYDLASSINNNPELQKLKRFSMEYYSFQEKNDTLIFSDMRFGTLQGWSEKDALFVFRFYITHKSGNRISISQTPIPGISLNAFTSLVTRIKGSTP